MANWITSFYHPYVGIIVECSDCGHRVKDDQAKRSKFCPGCGKEMENYKSAIFPKYFEALNEFTKD